jgi:hypothetical protein
MIRDTNAWRSENKGDSINCSGGGGGGGAGGAGAGGGAGGGGCYDEVEEEAKLGADDSVTSDM